ncbi:MAG: hypothetical protein EHM70_02440 [Chloroflexota bacterium]|nr:MAG: hypothetical protein EHM70_02440 [Chloroflexota bacterium]
MRNWISSLLLIAALLATAPANAQENIKISSLKVDLWPEYDRPSMLVIYRFSLSSDTTLPAQIALSIPTQAGDPTAVAVGQSEELVADVPFNRQVQGEWTEISFTATFPVVQFEYYDPRLTFQEDQRHYEYQWPGDYAVDFMVVEIQQPLDASNVSISPSFGNGETRSDGMVYYTKQVGELDAGQQFSFSLNYSKSSEVLSITGLEVQPSKPLTSDTPGRVQPESLLPWILGIAGIALAVGGGVWYWQSSRQETPTPARRRRRSTSPAVPSKATPEAGIYCHHCGKRANPGDRFCRSCGARLRLE